MNPYYQIRKNLTLQLSQRNMEENLMFILTRKDFRSNMKKILFSFVCLVFISCGGSDDVDENIAAIDPIIGAWSIEVESTYIVDDEQAYHTITYCRV